MKLLFKFTLICTVVGIVIMCISMSVGELMTRPDLFNYFIQKPKLWGWISLETAVSLAPISLLGAAIISKLKAQRKGIFYSWSLLTWFLLYCSIAFIYGLTMPSNSSAFNVMKPEILWGWIMPGILTLFFQIWLSSKLFQKKTEEIK